MALFGTHLASSAIFSSGTPEQWSTWLPRCFGTPDDPVVAAFCSSEPDAGSDVSANADPRPPRRGRAGVGDHRAEAWATNGGIADVHVVVAAVDPDLGSRGQAAVRRPRSR